MSEWVGPRSRPTRTGCSESTHVRVAEQRRRRSVRIQRSFLRLEVRRSGGLARICSCFGLDWTPAFESRELIPEAGDLFSVLSTGLQPELIFVRSRHRLQKAAILGSYAQSIPYPSFGEVHFLEGSRRDLDELSIRVEPTAQSVFDVEHEEFVVFQIQETLDLPESDVGTAKRNPDLLTRRTFVRHDALKERN